MQVPVQLETWPESMDVRRASVNNFGYGGANAHVIMEDYASFKSTRYQASNGISNGVSPGEPHPATNGISNGMSAGEPHLATNGISNGVSAGEPHPATNGVVKEISNRVTTNGFTNEVTNGRNGYHKSLQSKIVLLSAKDEQATQAMAANLKEHLLKSEVGDDEHYFDSLAYTLSQRRTRFPWVATQSVQQVSGLIKAIESGRMEPVRTRDRPRLGFVFTGQGAQWYAMGRELIEEYPIFKATLEEAERYLSELGATWSLIGIFRPTDEDHKLTIR